MKLQGTLGSTFSLVVHASLLITVANALPLETRQTRVAQETSIVDQGQNIWQKYSLEISIGVVAFLAIAGWLYWRYRQKQKAIKEKAKTAPATESEEEKLRRLALLKKQDAANGFIASMFSGLLGNQPQR